MKYETYRRTNPRALEVRYRAPTGRYALVHCFCPVCALYEIVFSRLGDSSTGCSLVVSSESFSLTENTIGGAE